MDQNAVQAELFGSGDAWFRFSEEARCATNADTMFFPAKRTLISNGGREEKCKREANNARWLETLPREYFDSGIVGAVNVEKVKMVRYPC